MLLSTIKAGRIRNTVVQFSAMVIEMDLNFVVIKDNYQVAKNQSIQMIK